MSFVDHFMMKNIMFFCVTLFVVVKIVGDTDWYKVQAKVVGTFQGAVAGFNADEPVKEASPEAPPVPVAIIVPLVVPVAIIAPVTAPVAVIAPVTEVTPPTSAVVEVKPDLPAVVTLPSQDEASVAKVGQ